MPATRSRWPWRCGTRWRRAASPPGRAGSRAGGTPRHPRRCRGAPTYEATAAARPHRPVPVRRPVGRRRRRRRRRRRTGRGAAGEGPARNQAGAEGCDYVTLSPVFATASKPGYGPALGLPGLAAFTTGAAPPAYALGGVHPPDVADCLAAGASGIAVMGPVMRTPQLVAAYLAALQEVAS